MPAYCQAPAHPPRRDLYAVLEDALATIPGADPDAWTIERDAFGLLAWRIVPLDARANTVRLASAWLDGDGSACWRATTGVPYGDEVATNACAEAVLPLEWESPPATHPDHNDDACRVRLWRGCEPPPLDSPDRCAPLSL